MSKITFEVEAEPYDATAHLVFVNARNSRALFLAFDNKQSAEDTAEFFNKLAGNIQQSETCAVPDAQRV